MKSYTDIDLKNAENYLLERTQNKEGQILREELTKFINEQSVHADGKTTVLWAGFYDQASAIANTDNGNIRILNKTLANDILGSVEHSYLKPLISKG